ncbi:MAG: AraC family transcriptional regulator [Clostridia bacterium]|nr:AraC family transcriptional regulator [Clostridia bacterium]
MEKFHPTAYFSRGIVKKDPHYHDCHQMILVVKGEVCFSLGRQHYTARAGNAVIFSRYENHSVRVLSREYERYVLELDPQEGGIEKSMEALLSNRPEGFCRVLDVSEEQGRLEDVFCRLAEEESTSRRFSQEMRRLLVHELLILLCRRMPELPPFNETVYRIQKQMEENCRASFTLEGLAAQYSLSPSNLSHRFKRITGVSVMEYLISCRMALAKRLLSETDLEIGRIVEACGFSDSSNFSRSFRQRNGLSPSDFRKQYTKKR